MGVFSNGSSYYAEGKSLEQNAGEEFITALGADHPIPCHQRTFFSVLNNLAASWRQESLTFSLSSIFDGMWIELCVSNKRHFLILTFAISLWYVTAFQGMLLWRSGLQWWRQCCVAEVFFFLYVGWVANNAVI